MLVVVLVLVRFQKKPWASSSYLLMVGAARLVVGKISNNLAGGPHVLLTG